MEAILSLFIFNDTYVVSFLVLGITIIVVALLLFNQKSPESVVENEVGNENIEGALRRVLGEKNWLPADGVAVAGGDSQKLQALENEVLEKDRKIADLNKQLTSGGGDGPAAIAGDSDLMERIAELEARLEEYEIIEDDIADLSLYKTENEKLKAELDRLKAMAGQASGSVQGPSTEEAPEGAVEAPVEEPPSEGPEKIQKLAEQTEEEIGAADLVAEFEKVVNNQADISPEAESSRVAVNPEEETGKVVMAGITEAKDLPQVKGGLKVHPKLANINPDSKEEAEVFIAELKSLKKGS